MVRLSGFREAGHKDPTAGNGEHEEYPLNVSQDMRVETWEHDHTIELVNLDKHPTNILSTRKEARQTSHLFLPR